MEDCRSKRLGKGNNIFDPPSPHPVLGGGNDTNDVIIVAACAHQQVLMQDILSKSIEQQIWRKVHWRDFFANVHIISTKSHFSVSLNRCCLLPLFSFLAVILTARTREHA